MVTLTEIYIGNPQRRFAGNEQVTKKIAAARPARKDIHSLIVFFLPYLSGADLRLERRLVFCCFSLLQYV